MASGSRLVKFTSLDFPPLGEARTEPQCVHLTSDATWEKTVALVPQFLHTPLSIWLTA